MEKAIVPAKLLENLAGSSYTIATRKLLSSVFSRQKRVAERTNPWYNGIYSHQIRRAAIDKHLKKSAIHLQRSSRKASRQNVPMRARCNIAKIGIINGNPRKEIIQHFILITGAGLKGISIMCKAASVTQLTRQATNEIPARRDERRAQLLDHDWVIATRHKLIVSVNRYDRGRAGAITYPGPTYVAIIMANIPLCQLLLTLYILACNNLATLSNFKENMRDEEGRLKPEVLFRGGPNENSKGSWGISKGFFPYPVPVDDGGPDYA
ncbi:unnamed protein product [Pieris brassicae]|uniref:Uncharacterized protein n=1 Tax=Pieris brassicae TaxID=7116 RepID=A0A9P0XGK6_PIEBR|nr:unnamed protein product [Pieris brassicae]CAH4035504.1 unnamed protein product [Pieris brassicae]CAH4035505.1 unnamed protein product [Pieris brassicae]